MVDSFQDPSTAQVTSIDQDSVQMALTSRPRNTTKQYEPKQIEFRVSREACKLRVSMNHFDKSVANCFRNFAGRKATQMAI